LSLALSGGSLGAEAKILLELNGALSADMAAQRLHIEGLKAHVQARGLDNGTTLDADMTGPMTLNLKDTKVAFAPLELQGTWQRSGMSAPLPWSLRSPLTYDGRQGSLDLPQLVLALAEWQVQGSLRGEQLEDRPRFTAQLSSQPVDPRPLLTRLGVDLPRFRDGNALQRVAAGFKATGDANRIKLSDLTLTLDDTHLTGQAEVQTLPHLKVGFNLDLDRLDLDRYAVAGGAGDAPGTAATPAAATPAAASPGVPGPAVALAPLQTLDVNGRLTVKQLKASNLRMEGLSATVQGNDGQIRVAPLKAGLYQGRLEGEYHVDVRAAAPVVTLRQTLSGVQIEPLLADVTGQEGRLTGRSEISTQATLRGTTAEALRSGLDGTLTFTLTDGAIKGINVAKMVRNAFNMLQGLPVEPETAHERTDFAELGGRFQFARGVSLPEANNVELKSPLLRIGGSGEVDLPGQRLHYPFKVKVVGTLTGQNGQPMKELEGLTLPMIAKGPFAEIHVKQDDKAIREFLLQRGQKELKKALGRELEKKGLGGLGGLLNQVLPGAGGAEPAPAEGAAAPAEAPPANPTPGKALEGLIKGLKF
ncbi:MAG: AsmA family protein, partial [Magnetococcus sp. WYHC-3]